MTPFPFEPGLPGAQILGGRPLAAPKRPMQQKRCSVEFWHYEALRTHRLREMKPVANTL
jgi:hypothetical protein